MNRIKKLMKSAIMLLKSEKKIPIPTPVNTTELLKGKVALITGGSGGIGLAMAESFLKSIPAGEGYAACAEKQLENRRAALQIRRECGVLSAEDERRETAFLTRVDAALAARSDAEAFEAVRLLAETSGTAAEQSRQNTLAALENGLRFIHETFGEEQELWILLHGLRECGAAAFLQKENSAVYRELLSNASPEARAAALREELKR